MTESKTRLKEVSRTTWVLSHSLGEHWHTLRCFVTLHELVRLLVLMWHEARSFLAHSAAHNPAQDDRRFEARIFQSRGG